MIAKINVICSIGCLYVEERKVVVDQPYNLYDINFKLHEVIGLGDDRNA